MNMWSSSDRHFITSSAVDSSAIQNIAQYIEDFIDLVENVPNDLVRQITQLHEHNHRYHQLLSKLESRLSALTNNNNTRNGNGEAKQQRALLTIQRCLIEIQEISDDKLFIVQAVLDQLDSKARQLDLDYRTVTQGTNSNPVMPSIAKANLVGGIGSTSAFLNSNSSIEHQITSSAESTASASFENLAIKETFSGNNQAAQHINLSMGTSQSMSNKRASSRRNNTNCRGPDNGLLHHEVTLNSTKKGIKRGGKIVSREMKKSKNNREPTSPPPTLYEDPPIDPDEPTYCLCEQVSFGEMICCDNSACTIEWFHFSCVSLTTKPKGRWFCPNCRGERSNIPKK